MMLAILAAAAVLAGEQSATPVAPVSVEAPASAPELSPAEQVRQLQMIYVQSCSDRAWGSFGDACNQMKRQIKDAEKAARKAANDRK